MKDDFFLGGAAGIILGVLIMGIIVAISSPDGTSASTKECIKDHPNVCREIITITTEYKEINND